jgi:hypothetical protein
MDIAGYCWIRLDIAAYTGIYQDRHRGIWWDIDPYRWIFLNIPGYGWISNVAAYLWILIYACLHIPSYPTISSDFQPYRVIARDIQQ